MSRAALVCALCAGAVAASIEAGAQNSRWQCAPTGSRALDPALAEAARDYLERVEGLYPRQALGLVRAGDHFYLLNSRDLEWSDRTRLHLLALRLRESYLAAERQVAGATLGSSPPAGGFVCLTAARAERDGLTRTPLGEIVLAAGHTVHLVDPQQPEVAVEVRAAQNRPLNLGEIILRSSRTGIYAGLTGPMSGQAKPAGGAAAGEPSDGTIIIRMASVAGLAAETRVEVPEWTVVAAPERPAASSVVAPVTVSVAVAPAPVQDPVPIVMVPTAPPADAIRPAENARIVVAAIPIAPAPVPVPLDVPSVPAVKVAPDPAAITVSGSVATTVRLPASIARAEVQPGAGQTYDEYAKAMKIMMATRRTGAVRSMSEMTYVHPAVEVIRYQPR